MVASNETKSGKCSSARVGQFFRYFVTNKRLFDWTWQLEMKPNLVIVPQQGLGIFFIFPATSQQAMALVAKAECSLA